MSVRNGMQFLASGSGSAIRVSKRSGHVLLVEAEFSNGGLGHVEHPIASQDLPEIIRWLCREGGLPDPWPQDGKRR